MQTSTFRKKIYRPNIDIEKLFIDYLTNSEHFQKNFYLDEKDPVKKVHKFIRFNKNTYLNRVYLFLNEIYSPFIHEIHNYTGEIRGFREIILSEKIPYPQKYSKVQEKWMQKDYRTLLINFMKEAKLIEVDDKFWTTRSRKAGHKCKGYRIHIRLYSNDTEWKSEYVYMDKKLVNNYKKKTKINPMEWLSSYPEAYKGIYKSISDWGLNVGSIPDSLKKECKDKISLFKKADWFTVGHGGRIFTPLTMLDKRLRKYIYYKPDPSLKMSLIDVSNCTYWGLSVLITKQREYFKKKDLDNINSFIKIIEPNKDKLSSIFSNYIQSSDYKRLLLDIYNLSDDYQFEKKVFTELIKLYEKDSALNEALTFILISCLGIIYDVFAEYFGVSRSTVKKELTHVINLRNKDLYHSVNKYKLFLEDKFNSVYKLILEVSNVDDNNFSFRVNNFESDLIIVDYGAKLLEQKIPFITIHDGMLVPSSQALQHMNDISLASQKLYGLPIPIKQENML